MNIEISSTAVVTLVVSQVISLGGLLAYLRSELSILKNKQEATDKHLEKIMEQRQIDIEASTAPLQKELESLRDRYDSLLKEQHQINLKVTELLTITRMQQKGKPVEGP